MSKCHAVLLKCNGGCYLEKEHRQNIKQRFFNEAFTNKRRFSMCILMILWIIRIAINFHTEVMRSSIIYALYMLIKSSPMCVSFFAHAPSHFRLFFKYLLVHDTHPFLPLVWLVWTHFRTKCCQRTWSSYALR